MVLDDKNRRVYPPEKKPLINRFLADLILNVKSARILLEKVFPSCNFNIQS